MNSNYLIENIDKKQIEAAEFILLQKIALRIPYIVKDLKNFFASLHPEKHNFLYEKIYKIEQKNLKIFHFKKIFAKNS